MPVWNPQAIDYSKGTEIYDYFTEKVYTEEEANKLPDHIKSRLLLKGKKIGCWVMTSEESKEALKCQNLK